MNLVLAADHAGFNLKEQLKVKFQASDFKFQASSFTLQDVGAFSLDPADDFPLIIKLAAEQVAKDPLNTKAIVLGRSGFGEAIVANKYRGVRAVIYQGGDLAELRLSREHNDANVLALAGAFLTVEQAWPAVQLWLNTAFSGAERHLRRLEQIKRLERELYGQN